MNPIFRPFKNLKTAMYYGKRVNIISIDAFENDEHFIEKIDIGYWDKNDQFHSLSLNPKEVFEGLIPC